jgi:hypothetical protein
MRKLFALLIVGVGIMATTGSATAQNLGRPEPVSSPTVSPYLNLFNNSNPYVYQSLVRPMVNQNRLNAQEQAHLNHVTPKPATLRYSKAEARRPTGHQANYQVYGHYYPTLNRQQ